MTQVAQSIHQNGFKSKISKAWKKLSSSFSSKVCFSPNWTPKKWTKSLIVKDGFSSPQEFFFSRKQGFHSPSKFIFSYVWTCLLSHFLSALYIFEKFSVLRLKIFFFGCHSKIFILLRFFSSSYSLHEASWAGDMHRRFLR